MRQAIQRTLMIAALTAACVTASNQSAIAGEPGDGDQTYSLSEYEAVRTVEEIYEFVVDALLNLFEGSDSPAQKVAPIAQKVAPVAQKVAPVLQKVQPVLQKVQPRIQKVRIAR